MVLSFCNCFCFFQVLQGSLDTDITIEMFHTPDPTDSESSSSPTKPLNKVYKKNPNQPLKDKRVSGKNSTRNKAKNDPKPATSHSYNDTIETSNNIHEHDHDNGLKLYKMNSIEKDKDYEHFIKSTVRSFRKKKAMKLCISLLVLAVIIIIVILLILYLPKPR